MNPHPLEKQLGITFSQPQLLKQALTHRSYLHDHRSSHLESNERLEFLGDAVLELWVSHYLYLQFPHFPEGKLTSLRALIVCTQNLAQLALSLNLDQHLQVSQGEAKQHGQKNPAILADTLEAVIGAVYLDLGYPAVDQVLTKLLVDNITKTSQKSIYKDPKSYFQELTQEKCSRTPTYQTLSESGPDHHKIFHSGVYLGTTLVVQGEGNSKQKAEENAAEVATAALLSGQLMLK